MNRGLVDRGKSTCDYKEGEARSKSSGHAGSGDPRLLDGGHTYRVVTESAAALPAHDAPRYVRVEFITGFDRETISDVVEARNTSNQVKDESLPTCGRSSSRLKRSCAKQPYYDLIAWSEYEELETGSRSRSTSGTSSRT